MFRTISMRQLEELLSARERGAGIPEFTLLDVRNREAFGWMHLDGAVNIPLAELDAACLCGRLAKSRPIIVYCACGSQSLRAARRLSEMGYEVVNASGGLNYYRGRHLTAGADAAGITGGGTTGGGKKPFDRAAQSS